jgi:hypothetical protein
MWDNTNLFDLLETVNTSNDSLAKGQQIMWYFTDLPVDWRIMSHEKVVKNDTDPGRDSVMANHILKMFDGVIATNKRHKALVIMNTRHGYGLIDSCFGAEGNFEQEGTTSLLMKACPGKVANVMLNSISLQYLYLFTPVQDGKWETAFAMLDNPNVGFNFGGSPFGNDRFDAAVFRTPSLKYEDVFTGFIFYKPLSDHIVKYGFPFEFEKYEDTLLRRAGYVSSSYLAMCKKRLSDFRNGNESLISTDSAHYAVLYNLINIVIIPTILLFCLLLSFIFLVTDLKRIHSN